MKGYQELKAKGTPYDSLIRKSAEKHGVSYDLMHAMVFKESSFNPNAKSPTGALGIAQFTRGTGKSFGLLNDADRKDPVKSIDAMGAYMAYNLQKTGGDELLAVLAYNQGLGGAGRKMQEAFKAGNYKGVAEEGLNFMKALSPYVSDNQVGRWKFDGSSPSEALEVQQAVAPKEVATPPRAPSVPMQSKVGLPERVPTAQEQYELAGQADGNRDKGVFEGTGAAISNAVQTSTLGVGIREFFHGTSVDVIRDVYRPAFLNRSEWTPEYFKTIREADLDPSQLSTVTGATSLENLKELIAVSQRSKALTQETEQKAGIGAQIVGEVFAAPLDPLTYVPIAGQAGKAAKGAQLISKAYAGRVASIAGQSALAAAGSEVLRDAYVGTEADIASAMVGGALFGAAIAPVMDGLSGAFSNAAIRLEANETARNLKIDSEAKMLDVVADESIPFKTAADGTQYKENPVGDGSVILEDGSIISEFNPLNPAFRDPAKAAAGIRLGGFTEAGLVALRSENAEIRGIAESILRPVTGFQDGSKNIGRMVAGDVWDMNQSRDRSFFNKFFGELSNKLLDDPEYKLSGMTKEAWLENSWMRIRQATENPEFLSPDQLSKVEREMMEEAQKWHAQKEDDLFNPSKYGNTSASPLLTGTRHSGKYFSTVYDDTLRASAIQRFGSGEGLQEMIVKSWLHGDQGYYNNPKLKAEIDTMIRTQYEEAHMAKLQEQANRADAYRESPEFKEAQKKNDEAKKAREKKQAERKAKAEKLDKEIERVRTALDKEIDGVRKKYAKKPAVKQEASKDPLTVAERKQYDLLAEDLASVESQLKVEKKGSPAREELMDELAEIKMFKKELDNKIDAFNRSSEVKAKADAQAKAEEKAEMDDLRAKRQAEIDRIQNAKKAMIKEIREAEAAQKKLDAEFEALQKSIAKQGELEAKMTLTDEQLDEAVRKMANDKAFGIAQSDQFSYSSAVSDAMDDTGKGLENNNFLESRHPFNSYATIIGEDGQPFRVDDLRSNRLDRIMPRYGMRVNADVAVMGTTGQTMGDLKTKLNDTRYASAADGATRLEGQAVMNTLMRMAGHSAQEPDNVWSTLARVATDVTFAGKNAWMGIQNLTEVAGMVVKGHTSALFKGVPMLNKMMGGIMKKDPDTMKDLQSLIFGQELDDSIRPRRADIREMVRSGTDAPAWVSNAVADVKYATGALSRNWWSTKVLQGTTNYIVDAARTGFLNDIVSHTLGQGGKSINPKILKSANVSDAQYEGIENLIKQYIKFDNGKMQIDPAIKNDPRSFDLWRLGDQFANEAIQRSGSVSNQSAKRYGAGVQLAMQFKTFVTRSLNSSMMSSYYEATKNGRAIEQIAMASVSIGLAGAFYMGRVATVAETMAEGDREQYLSKALHENAIAYAAISRARGFGILGVANIPMAAFGNDQAAMVRSTLTPERVERADRPETFSSAGGKFGGVLDQIPALGMAASISGAINNAAGLAGANYYSDQLSYRDALYNSLRNIIPNDPVSQKLLTWYFQEHTDGIKYN